MIKSRNLAAVLATGVLALSACSGDPQPNPQTSAYTPSVPTITTPPVTTIPPVAQPKPPVPAVWPTSERTCDGTIGKLGVITSINYGVHGNHDRIVFNFEGELPACQIQYVTKLIEDGSGNEYTVPGSHFLELILTPARTHTNAGDSTLFPRAETVNFPVLKSYDVRTDYESVVHIAIGLTKKAGFRIGWVDDGSTARLWVDLQH